jgi:HEAT repeat protein
VAGSAAIPALVDAAAGDNLPLSAEARRLLPIFGPAAIDKLLEVSARDYERPPRRRQEAIAAIARMGKPALPRILEIFTTENGNVLGHCSSGVLAQMGTPAIEPLIALSRHPTSEVRVQTVTILANIYYKDPRVFSVFMEGLTSENGAVRMYSAMGLGALRDHRTADGLLKALDSPSVGAREAAAYALAHIYEPRFLKPLVMMARNDPKSSARDAAANALKNSGDPLAKRLGLRYEPMDADPAGETAAILTYYLFFVVTGGILLLVGCIGVPLARLDVLFIRYVAFGFATLVCGPLGFAWGRLLMRISAEAERTLLFFVVPVTALLGFFLVALVFITLHAIGRRISGRLRCVILWSNAIAAFYAGYGIGWLALWGYL